jgi:lysophospholipase L1-like esterase
VERAKSWLRSRPPRASALALLALAATLAVVVGLEAGVLGGQGVATAGASPDSIPSMTAPAPSSSPTASTPTPSATPAPTASPTPTPAPTAPPLPALVGAIGDSYSEAYNVAPAYPRDHPQFSWVTGTAKNDGVFSLAERFAALGGSPKVVDAATSGRKMSDAPRQATAVVAAAKKLSPGQTAYVTFELGTNDLCDAPMTDPASFESDLRSAVSILRAGLPTGSRILMVSVPDFSHLRDITQADPAARAKLAASTTNNCPPYLGANNPTTPDEAATNLRLYDASLARVCDEIKAADAVTGKLYCTANEALLSMSDFTIADLGTIDYFHPSLSGQNKMAQAAWATDVWSAMPLPPGAAAIGPAGVNLAAVSPIPELALALPLIGPWAARRRRRGPRSLVRPGDAAGEVTERRDLPPS